MHIVSPFKMDTFFGIASGSVLRAGAATGDRLDRLGRIKKKKDILLSF